MNGPLEPGVEDTEHCSGQRAGPGVGSPGRQVSTLSWAVIQGRPSSSELCQSQRCPQWHGDDDRWREAWKEHGRGVYKARLMGRGSSPGTSELTLPLTTPGQLSTASSADEPRLSASAPLVIHFLKAPPAPALTPAPVPSQYLCTPRQDHGLIVSGPSKDPDLASGHGPYSFTLGPNPTVQRDWRLQTLNGVWWGKGGRLWPRQGGGVTWK